MKRKWKQVVVLVAVLLCAVGTMITAAMAVETEEPTRALDVNPDAAEVAAEEGQTVEIVEDEVPLSAIPLANLENESTGPAPQVYVLFGGALVALSVVGLYFVLRQRAAERAEYVHSQSREG